MCGLGDVIAQKFIEKRKLAEYDVPRTLRMSAIGLFFTVQKMNAFFFFKFRVLVRYQIFTSGPCFEWLVLYAGQGFWQDDGDPRCSEQAVL